MYILTYFAQSISLNRQCSFNGMLCRMLYYYRRLQSCESFSLGKASFKEPTDLKDDNLSYGIIFDCGSSGTRVYIYYWPPHNGDNKNLLDIHQVLGDDSKPLSKKVTPGVY